jgi:hypothetical protein
MILQPPCQGLETPKNPLNLFKNAKILLFLLLPLIQCLHLRDAAALSACTSLIQFLTPPGG